MGRGVAGLREAVVQPQAGVSLEKLLEAGEVRTGRAPPFPQNPKGSISGSGLSRRTLSIQEIFIIWVGRWFLFSKCFFVYVCVCFF